MGLSGWLLRWAAGHARPLLVPAGDGTRARLLAEAELARRRLRPAVSVAEAGLLVVCGTPGEELTEAVRTVWAGMPVPRARVDLPAGVSPRSVARAFDRAVARLADREAQWRDAAALAATPWTPPDEHRPMDGEHGGGSAGGHGGGGEHEHHMGAPGGVPMAERGPDRDGLTLDRLHVPLGPVLPDWPCGLVVETVLQGDVIQEAVVRWVEPAESFWTEPSADRAAGLPVTCGEAARRQAVSRLDALGRLLSVAGWPAAARRARTLRDLLFADAPPDAVARPYERFERQVRRSATLRWMLRDIGPTPDGDTLSRLDGLLTRTRAAISSLGDNTTLGDNTPVDGGSPPVRNALGPGLLVGAELATARLIVAGLDPEPAVTRA
ncbi:hypothetical protein DMB42_10550 [Nonomuraea sp. WAC 01424]|uniref:hypothetical protein n=1 Tax=Nonomuraea sp. WAC 01424 TaxID=2203200 RepID=UPI000F78A632|nr:hypothetical protein [Nonomuraea sp. WAC 01424]RSN12627.1 hypothetical protein DMB42_10550 [Nonomuraea sp. WAC 01424]